MQEVVVVVGFQRSQGRGGQARNRASEFIEYVSGIFLYASLATFIPVSEQERYWK